jgi:hypothetical protein
MDALKKELESSLKCYEECRTELKDMVTQYDAQKIILEANANLIAELKRVKGELEDTLEKKRSLLPSMGGIFSDGVSSCTKELWCRSLGLQNY